MNPKVTSGPPPWRPTCIVSDLIFDCIEHNAPGSGVGCTVKISPSGARCRLRGKVGFTSGMPGRANGRLISCSKTLLNIAPGVQYGGDWNTATLLDSLDSVIAPLGSATTRMLGRASSRQRGSLGLETVRDCVTG